MGGILQALSFDRADAPWSSDELLGCWTVARRAMACEFVIYLPGWVADFRSVAQVALDEVDRMEDLLTVYRDESHLSYVNRCAAEGPVEADERLFSLLRRAAVLTEQTGGAFDASAGALIRAWGYVRGPRRVPSDAELADALARAGMRHVALDPVRRTVRYDVRGLEINLGSIGKGYALDRALDRVRTLYGVRSALMHGGLSSVCALGSPDGDGPGWCVGIQDPYDSRRRLVTVRLKDRSLGTSGAANQYFVHDGQRYGHVLDPRHGRPADELASASVVAADAATADALATAFFVMGLDKVAAFCQDHVDIGAVLVLKRAPDDRDGIPRVVTFNLSRRDVGSEGAPIERRLVPADGGARA